MARKIQICPWSEQIAQAKPVALEIPSLKIGGFMVSRNRGQDPAGQCAAIELSCLRLLDNSPITLQARPYLRQGAPVEAGTGCASRGSGEASAPARPWTGRALSLVNLSCSHAQRLASSELFECFDVKYPGPVIERRYVDVSDHKALGAMTVTGGK
jgi:hypothetical protein